MISSVFRRWCNGQRRKFVEYLMVEGRRDEIDKRINSLIAEGWEPWGSPFKVGYEEFSDEFICVQSMVLYLDATEDANK